MAKRTLSAEVLNKSQERGDKVLRLRGEGLSYQLISERMGVGLQRCKQLAVEARSRARKEEQR